MTCGSSHEYTLEGGDESSAPVALDSTIDTLTTILNGLALGLGAANAITSNRGGQQTYTPPSARPPPTYIPSGKSNQSSSTITGTR